MIDFIFIGWMKNYVKKIYCSHKNNDIETFKVRTTHHGKRKIDFIVETYGGKYLAIEFEPGDTYGEITTGAVQLNDFFYLVENGLKILIDDKEIIPDYYLLATKYSKDGYLYKNDKRIIQTGGYSPEEPLVNTDNTLFHTIRWMWRFCGRKQEQMCLTNPIGVSKFSAIGRSFDGEPEIEINGHYKLKISEI